MNRLDNISVELLTHTAARVENVPDSDYFGEKYKDYVSNSLLALLNPDQGGSPSKFIEGFGTKDSPALELGSAVHQMILERDKYFLSEIEKPTGKIGGIIDDTYTLMRTGGFEFERAITAACITNEYYSNALTEKRIQGVIEKGQEYYDFLVQRDSDPSIIVLTASMQERLKMCMESVKANSSIRELLLPDTEFNNILTFNEDVITMTAAGLIESDEDELFNTQIGFNLKAKIDNWYLDFDNKRIVLNDLKTTSSPIQYFGGREVWDYDLKGNKVKKFLPGSFQKYHYPRQMAMYKTLLQAYCMQAFPEVRKWPADCFDVNMVVVETVKPYHSHVFRVGKKWLENGYMEWTELLQRLIFHKQRGFDRLVELTPGIIQTI